MTTKTITLADGLDLPLEACTETFAILAKRGAGKTHTSVVMSEGMLAAGLQVIICDPVGVWWGLRSSKDGAGEGFEIPIFGGDHGDIGLAEDAGALVADTLIEERASAVLDFSLFRKAQQTHFMTAFAERLYRKNRQPLHLILDEADAFAPQRPMKGQERMLGAVEDLVRRGRARGLGITLITQRSAVLNKDVLTQTECLITLRTTSPQDRAAIDEWVKAHGTDAERRELMESIASLPTGEAWFWSPSWLRIFRRVKVRDRRTFDSSATPQIGMAEVGPRKASEVDIGALRAHMEASEVKSREEAKSVEDLRGEVRNLRAELRKAEKRAKAAGVPEIEVKRRENEALRRGREEGARVGKDGERDALRAIIEQMVRIGRRALANEPETRRDSLVRPVNSSRRIPTVMGPSAPIASPNGPLDGPQQRIANAIAWMEAIGMAEPSQLAVAYLAGYKFGAGSYNNARGRLNQSGMVEYLTGNRIRLTQAGRKLAHRPEETLTREKLHTRVLAKLPGPEQRLLRPLLEAWPESMTNEDLALAAGYTPGAGSYNNPRGRLRSFGLAEYPEPGKVRAADVLFPEVGK